MSAITSVRVPPRSVDPEGVRRQLRHIATTRAAARYMAPERAREIAANLAGVDDDLITLDAITEAIERRRIHFALKLTDDNAIAAASAVFAAWLEACA